MQDHLLTPKNSALIIIDYQPVQITSVASMAMHGRTNSKRSTIKCFGQPRRTRRATSRNHKSG